MGELAAVFAALFAAHQVADHWVQTPRQSALKGVPGPLGRAACFAHVATYTLTAVLFLAGLMVVGWRPGPNLWQVEAGLLVSAVTHYIADRRAPLRRMAYVVGKTRDWVERGGGLYLLDQSWHIGWLYVAALIIAA